jgi:hypothetical protein
MTIMKSGGLTALFFFLARRMMEFHFSLASWESFID